MSFVSFDGEVLRIKLSGVGDQWSRDVFVARSLSGREYLVGERLWVAPPTQENIGKLLKSGFQVSPEVEVLFRRVEGQSEVDSADTFAAGLARRFPSPVLDPQLFPVQNPHAQRLIYALEQKGAALDGSDTGTGKTYVALAIAKHMGLFPIVLTPKAVKHSWTKVARDIFRIPCFVSNYEQYKLGNTEYLKVDKDPLRFHWNLPTDSLIIFDEVHRCKNYTTINSKMLINAKRTGAKILALSATIANDPLQMYAIGQVLGLFHDWPGFWRWAAEHGAHKGIWGWEFSREDTPETRDALRKIHAEIYPMRGSRLRTAEFGDLFPENRILAEPFSMGTADKIQQLYDIMREELHHLHDRTKNDRSASALVEILRARQEIELLKVPTMCELAEDHVEEGNSVILFVNFQATVDALAERLKTRCIIDGRIPDEEREKNRQDFQDDKQRIIICNNAAGGVGISLHDIHGRYPRVTLISPTYSAVDLVQSLGRAPRAGAKSKVLQKLIYCADTIEEEIAANVRRKIHNIQLINDGDLLGGLV